VLYLDTHVVAWLYDGRFTGFPPAALAALEAEQLLISPMVGLELELLFERGRAAEPAGQVLSAVSTEIGLTVCDLAFTLVATRAREERWTRDPFDRLIVAQAKARGAPLLTRDERIRSHYPRAIWDTPLST
jgi:PIN domain nuclease of toxin-antitoxin system